MVVLTESCMGLSLVDMEARAVLNAVSSLSSNGRLKELLTEHDSLVEAITAHKTGVAKGLAASIRRKEDLLLSYRLQDSELLVVFYRDRRLWRYLRRSEAYHPLLTRR